MADMVKVLEDWWPSTPPTEGRVNLPAVLARAILRPNTRWGRLGMVIGSRRNFVVSAAFVLAWSTSYAEQGSPFVGEWAGNVDGIGDTRLIITGVKPSGQVEGRMEFTLQSFVSTFADKWNSADRTNYGVVSGSVLTIESALGGIYRLTLTGNQLEGSYVRGTTFNGTAAFKKN